MIEVVILAAGEGKRMNSSAPKVLQPVGGQPMLCHLTETARSLGPDAIHVVVGAGGDQVEAALAEEACRFAVQSERLGTGHAALQALPQIDPEARVLILPGDMPLIRADTLKHLLDSPAELALLSFLAEDPTGYGRVLRDESGQVCAIREHKDASEAERAVGEVNSGVICARAADWTDWLARVGADNAQGEYYLTDCIALAVADGRSVEAVVAADADELLGANDRAQLAQLEAIFQQRARRSLMAAGVTLLAPETVQIRGVVECGRDVVLDAQVTLEGQVRLGEGVTIGQGCVVRDSELAPGSRLEPYCVVEGVRSTGPCSVGPFARLRPGTQLAAGVKIGNFVEVKKARFAAGAKASHLSYVGDAQVGERANLGAGTITCNYDGANKHHTEIGADAFIGSNSALVAPVSIGAEATIGAGSVIGKDAPAAQLTLTRSRQRSIADWQRPRKKS
ncbi:bifunctional UDP-N-acetylglucosamine diphosphorylase/glucosamine-1-phosphate N-acetyltransferase GlmU [Wenzhouxiangella limi]|uniref:Bifunctional protein GlmU n=1 Tax=Wenzhouxiangella limi TaxID=2707351 RepID=A0A845UT88_9GAMM|nr:bifunctional UDP-N-acetylglucosamine diphosphorylase/glucosamine-1-phosphate N-acetyltransferase GlmU [Wenzhouxiangella limi]NDY95043.1 UDP-N-acetylglucosamine diphosphorylase/glucosamine-1-phosphate N-acetyltransferase [Wenzhouxiangella limi]